MVPIELNQLLSGQPSMNIRISCGSEVVDVVSGEQVWKKKFFDDGNFLTALHYLEYNWPGKKGRNLARTPEHRTRLTSIERFVHRSIVVQYPYGLIY